MRPRTGGYVDEKILLIYLMTTRVICGVYSHLQLRVIKSMQIYGDLQGLLLLYIYIMDIIVHYLGCNIMTPLKTIVRTNGRNNEGYQQALIKHFGHAAVFWVNL